MPLGSIGSDAAAMANSAYIAVTTLRKSETFILPVLGTLGESEERSLLGVAKTSLDAHSNPNPDDGN